jgi:hypothetical protein
MVIVWHPQRHDCGPLADKNHRPFRFIESDDDRTIKATRISGQRLAAPTAALLLARHGQQVFKVERFGSLDTISDEKDIIFSLIIG